MKVWVVTWDVRNNGTGCQVFASKDRAVAEVLLWIEDLLSGKDPGQEPTMQEYEHQLVTMGFVHFELYECHYTLEQQEVVE